MPQTAPEVNSQRPPFTGAAVVVTAKSALDLARTVLVCGRTAVCTQALLVAGAADRDDEARMAGFRFTLEPALTQRRRVRDALALEFVRLAGARSACDTECTGAQDRRSETVRRLLDAPGCDRAVFALDAARLERFQRHRQGRLPSLEAEVRRARQAVTVADRAVRALEVLQASQATRYAAAVAERQANDVDEINGRGGATPP